MWVWVIRLEFNILNIGKLACYLKFEFFFSILQFEQASTSNCSNYCRSIVHIARVIEKQ